MKRLQILAFALVALLAVETGLRITYPYDLYIWSESAFLTNMLKMEAGEPIFTAPADVNSQIYSPGLEYLAYGLLHPLHLEGDIRFARAIVVVLGAAACLIAARLLAQVGRDGAPGPGGRLGGLAAALLLLRLFRSSTGDAVHPDNLYILHAVVTLLLCYLAISKARFDLALAAMAWAGLGILARQTAAPACLGAGVALIASRRWTRRQALALAAAGAASLAAAASPVLLPEYARFYNVELLLREPLEPLKILSLIQATAYAPYRIVLVVLALPACLRLKRHTRADVRAFLQAWLWVGLAEVAPAGPALFKTGAADNHLTIIDMWLFLVVWLAYVRQAGAPAGTREGVAASWPKWGTAVAGICLLSLAPLKLPAPPSLYTYAGGQEQLIRQDLAAGKRVLLAHGAAALVRAGSRAAPLDRAMASGELWSGGMQGLARTAERFRQRYYDRVYLNVIWYDIDTQMALADNYRVVARIPPPQTPFRLRYLLGYQEALYQGMLILEPAE